VYKYDYSTAGGGAVVVMNPGGWRGLFVRVCSTLANRPLDPTEGHSAITGRPITNEEVAEKMGRNKGGR
jgi:hypothetical protein